MFFPFLAATIVGAGAVKLGAMSSHGFRPVPGPAGAHPRQPDRRRLSPLASVPRDDQQQ